MFGIYDALTISLLVVAIGANSLSVYVQKRYGYYTKFGDKAYTIHSVVILVAWGIFIVSEFVAALSSWRLESTYPLIGYGIMITALTIFILALRQIGIHGLGNGNFFGKPVRKLGGIYKIIPEPIYVSYSLWFLGIGFATSLKVFFVLAFASFVGLVLVEARVERPN